MEDLSTKQLDQQNRTINRTSTNPDRRTTKTKESTGLGKERHGLKGYKWGPSKETNG